MSKAARISPKTKVSIVLAKSIKDITRKTDSLIARELNVSQPTVSILKYELLAPEQQAEVDKKRKELGIHGVDLSFDALIKGKELVAMANSVRDLPAVMGAAKIGHDISRLEADKPTVIQDSPDSLPRALFDYLMKTVASITAERAREEVLKKFPGAREVKLIGDGLPNGRWGSWGFGLKGKQRKHITKINFNMRLNNEYI